MGWHKKKDKIWKDCYPVVHYIINTDERIEGVNQTRAYLTFLKKYLDMPDSDKSKEMENDIEGGD